MIGDDAEFNKWDDKLGFYTPILKNFLTEFGIECAKHGMQIYSGHGYIKEWAWNKSLVTHVSQPLWGHHRRTSAWPTRS